MRRVAMIGAVVGIGATMVAAYALYQLLHFETCFSSDVVGKAAECTKHVVGDGYLLAAAVVAVVIGLFIANAMFRVLFPLFWLIMGTGALLAAATSSTTVSPGVEGAPAPVAHLPNVSGPSVSRSAACSSRSASFCTSCSGRWGWRAAACVAS